MATLVSIDVINKTIPSLNNENIPIINKPNPCYGYLANAKEVKQLIQMPNYWIYEASTNIVISGKNYYDYFPEEGSGGASGGVTKEEVQVMINESKPVVDSVVSTTSTNAIQNSTITNFVNSSISTNTANYVGQFNSIEELNAYTGTVTNNDYAFVVGEDESGNTKYDRHKWVDTSSEWLLEYTLNNSSFTAEEWASIQSGVKSQDVTQINTNKDDIANLSTTKADKTELVGKDVTGTKYTINGTEYTAGSNAEIFNDYTNNKAIGSDSHAEGGGTTASGDNSHAEGTGTKATEYASHAEGGGTTAKGSCSHAEGSGTTASGQYSHAEGGNTTASGYSSHAEGAGTTASGNCSHAEGSETKATGNYSHSEGGGTTASGMLSHAEGGSTTASGPQSHAEGAETTASGPQSHAEGVGTTASSDNSHAEGASTTASGRYSHSEGYSTNKQSSVINITSSTTNDEIITAWNSKKFSLTKGDKSHVEGADCLALGTTSHAEGNGSIASGDNSHAEGGGTTASSEYQHVQGKFNIEDTESKYAFIIGNGTSDTDRSNAFAIDWDGKIYQGDSSIGIQLSQNVDLTLEEYEALSDAEKNNGTYYNIIES